MKLSPAAEFAIRGMVVLAQQFGQPPVTLDAICARRKLSKQYLTKIFASLARADLVVPVRGKHGGYNLSRHPREISLLQIIEAVEGPMVLNFCQHEPTKCDHLSCAIRPVWSDIQRYCRQRLGEMTLQDCVGGNCSLPA